MRIQFKNEVRKPSALSIVLTDQTSESVFKAVSETDHYEAPYWFVSQLFEANWEPRDTLQHSPFSDDAYLKDKDYIVTGAGEVISLSPFARPDIEEDVCKRPQSIQALHNATINV